MKRTITSQSPMYKLTRTRIAQSNETVDFAQNGKKIKTQAILVGILTLVFSSFFSESASAQYCTMVCNTGLNVSLGPSCSAEVTYDMILEDPNNPVTCSPNGPQAYTVTVMNYFNAPIPTSPNITGANIGETLNVKVKHWATGNNCWGTITIEDKVAPEITCPADVTISCTDATAPTLTGTLIANDCSDFTVNYSDMTESFGCSNPTVIITRTWTAIDIYNNVNSCVQIISVAQPSPGSIEFPPNLDDISGPALDCVNPNTDPSNTGFPTINGAPIVNGGWCNMGVTHTDQIINICEGSYKILRHWTAADWCSGAVLQQIQIIKVKDSTPPVLNCPADLTVGTTSSLACTATVILPNVSAFDDCSGSYTGSVLTPAGMIFGTGGIIQDVPLGNYVLTYNVTDDCGNTAVCDVNLTVVDDDAPSMICDEITTITLTNNGTAQIFAETFDDGSYDNCCFSHFQVKRSEEGCGASTTFGSSVQLCCDDIGTDVMVELQGVDCYNNANSCMVIVHVNDVFDPTIICPTNKTITCIDDYTDLSITGQPVAYDGCEMAGVTYGDQISINSCGVGTVIRSWTAADTYGNTASCTQTINIVDNTPVTVNFPPNYDATSCISVNSLHPDSLPAIYSGPVIFGDECELMALNYSDQVYQVAPPACFKIIRTWTVIDWCAYDPNSTSMAGYFTGTQILKVFDTEAPTFDCAEDFMVEILEAGCATTVTLPDVTNIVDCSDNTNVTVTSDFGSGYGPFVNIGEGIYSATYQVTDGCGNSSSCTIDITVVDGKKPTPYCANGLVIELMNTVPPMIEIWANDFDAGSFDNCPGDLEISFSSITSETSALFDCNDVGQQSIEIWVTDAAGNQDFCQTSVFIQDNMNLCGGDPIQPLVGGAISNEMGMSVENVTVTLSDPNMPDILTGPDGNYEFLDLQLGNDYTVSPEKNTTHLNGVTTYDLVLIRKHILGETLLDSPYKIIAADANRSNNITTVDMIDIRKLILFVSDNFPNNESWRFVDSNYDFINPLDPLTESFPEVYNINDIDNDMIDINFVAIKVGDLNDSAIPNNLLGAEDRNNADELIFELDDEQIQASETYRLDFRAKDFNDIIGYQFTLKFDENKLEFLKVEEGALPHFSAANFGFTMLDEGVLTTSWHNLSPSVMDEDAILFSMHFQAKEEVRLSEAVQITSEFTKAEAYKEDATQLDVALTFKSADGIPVLSGGTFELFQNRPNPFQHSTIVSFSLPETQEATLTVFDVSGSTLAVVKGNYPKGYNEILIPAEDLPKGTLYYQLKTNSDTATKKMILIN